MFKTIEIFGSSKINLIVFQEPRHYGTWLNGCGVTFLVTEKTVNT
jgi:hypothetical protein